MKKTRENIFEIQQTVATNFQNMHNRLDNIKLLNNTIEILSALSIHNQQQQS